MKIIEKDFKIDIADEVYVLSTLKSKKEIKEGDGETYKIYGYFTNIVGALKRVVKFREGKKYPFKEPIKPIKIAIQSHSRTLYNIDSIIAEIEAPIVQMKKKIFNANR